MFPGAVADQQDIGHKKTFFLVLNDPVHARSFMVFYKIL
jgi:hypothetical protein